MYEPEKKGVTNIIMHDVTRMSHSYVVYDAFRFTNIVLVILTYNNNALHPTMSAVIEDMEKMAIQNRGTPSSGTASGPLIPQDHGGAHVQTKGHD